MRIGIVAPSTPLAPGTTDRLTALAAAVAPLVELVIDGQVHAAWGHFAGDDAHRAHALLAMMGRRDIDAIWFAKGGYGAGRIAAAVVAKAPSAAGDKSYLGYSDAGMLLGAFDRHGIGRVAHGAMPGDLALPGREAAVARSLAWLATGDPAALEPGAAEAPVAAFNLMTLSMLVGTPLMPDLTGRILIIEEVAEHLYAIDRALRHVLMGWGDRLAGLRLGNLGAVPVNDRPFGEEGPALVARACADHGVPYLGRALIGHDGDNHVVPFTRAA